MKPNFSAEIINELRLRVIAHNEATSDPAAHVKLQQLKNLYKCYYGGNGDPHARALARIDSHLVRLREGGASSAAAPSTGLDSQAQAHAPVGNQRPEQPGLVPSRPSQRSFESYTFRAIPLFESSDLIQALYKMKRRGQNPSPSIELIKASAEKIEAAARVLIREIIGPKRLETNESLRDILWVARDAQEILAVLGAQFDLEDELALVGRVSKVTTPNTLVVAAIEGEARAAGIGDPKAAVDAVLMGIANLHFWAQAAGASFQEGDEARRARVTSKLGLEAPANPEEDSPAAATSKEIARAISAANPDLMNEAPKRSGAARQFGLVIIEEYVRLTGAPARFSRVSETGSRPAGSVGGPLPRFLAAVFERLRERVKQEPTLQQLQGSPNLNPTPETLAYWIGYFNGAG